MMRGLVGARLESAGRRAKHFVCGCTVLVQDVRVWLPMLIRMTLIKGIRPPVVLLEARTSVTIKPPVCSDGFLHVGPTRKWWRRPEVVDAIVGEPNGFHLLRNAAHDVLSGRQPRACVPRRDDADRPF